MKIASTKIDLCIAELGSSKYNHVIGGDAWTIRPPEGFHPLPVLIAKLDLSDPVFSGLGSSLEELPLCLRVDGRDLNRQIYEVDSQRKTIKFLSLSWHSHVEDEDLIRGPLDEEALCFREAMVNELDPTRAYDTVLGGSGFFGLVGSLCGCLTRRM